MTYAFLSGLAGILCITGLTILLARNLSRPIRSLNKTAIKIAEGDLDARASVTTSDEVGHLAITFNTMIERLQNWHAELGDQVNARTADLKRTNEELSEEINNRKRVEEALRDSEEKFSKAFLNSPVTITLSSIADGRYLDVNETFSKTFGWRRDEVIGRKSTDIGLWPDTKDREELMMLLSGKGAIQDHELTLLTKHGKSLNFLVSLDIMVLGGEKCLISAAVDITERKRAEEALRGSDERYRTFFEQDTDGVVVLDTETTRPIEFNDQVCKQLGYSREEFALLRVSDIEAKETDQETQAHFRKIMSEGYDDFETLQRTKQGEIRHVNISAQVIEIAGHPVYHCIWRDITDRKRIEEQVKASLKEKEVLLSEIHHRVKNNMQVIISLLKLQSDKIEDKKYGNMFKESQNRILSMALVHEQLYMSKDFANIDFGEYVKSFVNTLFVSHGVDTNKVRLNIDIKDVALDLENAIPCGLIINELVSNSLKHAFPEEREGEIAISVLATNKDEIELTVSDDGVGIPEDLDIRDTESMGLHIVKILAEQTLEGKMELNRTEGTKFHFLLKRAKYRPRI